MIFAPRICGLGSSGRRECIRIDSGSTSDLHALRRADPSGDRQCSSALTRAISRASITRDIQQQTCHRDAIEEALVLQYETTYDPSSAPKDLEHVIYEKK